MTTLLAVVALAAAPALASQAGDAAAAPTLAMLAGNAAAVQAARAIAAPDRFVVLATRTEGESRIAEEGTELEALEITGPDATGAVRVRLRVTAGGQPRGEVRATVRGRVYGPALVARKTLLRGEPVAADAVAVEDADLTRLPSRPFRDAAELAGLVPARNLGSGRVLGAALFEAEPVVRRGDRVEMRIEQKGLTVVANAIALADGAPGDVIAAANDATGVRVRTLVLPDGSLLVSEGRRRPQ